LTGNRLNYHRHCYEIIFSESPFEIHYLIDNILLKTGRLMISGDNYYNNLYLGLKLSNIIHSYLSINFDLTNSNNYNDLFLIYNYNFLHNLLIDNFLNCFKNSHFPNYLIIIDSRNLFNPYLIKKYKIQILTVYNEIIFYHNKRKISFDFMNKTYSLKLREIDLLDYNDFIKFSNFSPFQLKY
jgi:hypothetical protein